MVTSAETAQVWEQDGVAGGEVRERIGAVDATFLEQRSLVCQDVPTRYMVQEAVADERTDATWKALVAERRQALGPSVLSVVSDRAKALIPLAEQGCECLSMPDFVHLMHDMVQSYALTMARQVRHAHQALAHAEAVLARHPGLVHSDPDRRAVQAEVHAQRAEGQRWAEVQRMSRHHLETLSLTRHPCGIADAAPQTSAQVQGQWPAAVEAIAAWAARHQLPHRHDAMQKVRKQLPALAALVDLWWEGLGQDVAPLHLPAPCVGPADHLEGVAFGGQVGQEITAALGLRVPADDQAQTQGGCIDVPEHEECNPLTLRYLGVDGLEGLMAQRA